MLVCQIKLVSLLIHTDTGVSILIHTNAGVSNSLKIVRFPDFYEKQNVVFHDSRRQSERELPPSVGSKLGPPTQQEGQD